MAQWVECLYKHKNEDLNSDPQQPSKNLGMVKWPWNLSTGYVETGVSEGLTGEPV